MLNGNSAVEPLIVTSQPLNNFYGPLSYSLEKKTSEPSTTKVVSTKKCVVGTPTMSNSYLGQVTSSCQTATSTPTTFVTFTSSIQKKKNETNSQVHRAIDGIVLIDNKEYQLVKGPLGQTRAVLNNTNILVKSPTTVIIKVSKMHQYNNINFYKNLIILIL